MACPRLTCTPGLIPAFGSTCMYCVTNLELPLPCSMRIALAHPLPAEYTSLTVPASAATTVVPAAALKSAPVCFFHGPLGGHLLNVQSSPKLKPPTLHVPT